MPPRKCTRQHSNTRVYRAHALRQQGWTWPRIADELGYADQFSAATTYWEWRRRQRRLGEAVAREG